MLFDFLYCIYGSFLFILHVSLHNIPYKKSFISIGLLHVCRIESKIKSLKEKDLSLKSP